MASIAEAAEALGLAASTLRTQIRLRKLRARKMGRSWFISDEEIERYRRESKRERST